MQPWSIATGLLSFLNPLRLRSASPSAIDVDDDNDDHEEPSFTAGSEDESPPESLSARGRQVRFTCCFGGSFSVYNSHFRWPMLFLRPPYSPRPPCNPRQRLTCCPTRPRLRRIFGPWRSFSNSAAARPFPRSRLKVSFLSFTRAPLVRLLSASLKQFLSIFFDSRKARAVPLLIECAVNSRAWQLPRKRPLHSRCIDVRCSSRKLASWELASQDSGQEPKRHLSLVRRRLGASFQEPLRLSRVWHVFAGVFSAPRVPRLSVKNYRGRVAKAPPA